MRNPTTKLTNKTVIVTGATGTIGKAIVKHLLRLDATVIVAVRNTEKARRVFKDKAVIIEQLDIGDEKSIDDFVKRMDGWEIFALINNAGTLSGSADTIIKTNFVGTMTLTKKMLPSVGRVVFQSSLAANSKRKNWVYGRSKRLLNCAVIQMNNPKLILAHPGVTGSEIIRRLWKPLYWFTRFWQSIVFHSPRTAALGVIYGLFVDVPNDSWLVPRGLFGVWGKPKIKKLPAPKQETIDEVKKLLP